jgi:PKD repeat protein
VENGVTPPASTTHTITDQQVSVPANAAVRRGLQPTVDLTVHGATSVHISVGDPVPLKAKIQMPPHTGDIAVTAWDCEGDGTYTDSQFDAPMPAVQTGATCTYDKPGTYYAALSVAGERNGVRGDYAQVRNLDRVRVIVGG